METALQAGGQPQNLNLQDMWDSWNSVLDAHICNKTEGGKKQIGQRVA